ncbi:MAG TPA: heme-binding protein [Thermoanaerobaculia bacterium]|nr:heme-binding protein [Thermoanaerobaculia bacterium]
MTTAEVNSLIVSAASSVNFTTLAVAVVDRPGNVLGLYVLGSPSLQVQDQAVGLARTGAFFSNGQAPLSSRTVRFISGLHFPPGIARTPNAALYGIENTNRGCDLNVTWNPGQLLPRATSISGQPCNAFNTSGCGAGPVTGKVVDLSGDPRDSNASAVNPGGLPIFRGTELIGGIGVAGVPGGQIDAAEFAAFSAFSAATPSLTPFPSPLPDPGVVFIDGIRLPFVRQTWRPSGVTPSVAAGTFVIPPVPGQCAPDGYLVGPTAGSLLSLADVQRIVQQAVDAANRTRAVIRLPLGQKTRMVIAVGDVDGTVLALYRMPDATVFSVDVAVAKARNVAWFSGPGAGEVSEVPPGTAISNRTLSFGGQPLFPAGIDGSGPGPFFDLFANDTLHPCSQGFAPPGPNQNGIVFFAGSLPLYKGNTLAGGLGVSGDGVEQDDYVTFLGAAGFLPPKSLWADNYFVSGVRLPFLKFPRNPER